MSFQEYLRTRGYPEGILDNAWRKLPQAAKQELKREYKNSPQTT